MARRYVCAPLPVGTFAVRSSTSRASCFKASRDRVYAAGEASFAGRPAVRVATVPEAAETTLSWRPTEVVGPPPQRGPIEPDGVLHNPAMTEPLSKSASWFAQMALIVTWLVALVVAVRLLVVSTWSRRTALAILQTGGTANVVTGVIVSTFAIACGAALCLYLIARLYSVVANEHAPTRTDLIVVVTVVLWEVLIVPLYIVAITIVVVALVVAAGRYRRGRLSAGGKLANPRIMGLVGVVVGVLVVLLVDNRPWLPPENITLGQKPEVITAYVLLPCSQSSRD